MVKLHVKNGQVAFQMRAGSDFVQNEMSHSNALAIISSGKVTESDRAPFRICVNDRYFFDGTITEDKPENGRKERK